MAVPFSRNANCKAWQVICNHLDRTSAWVIGCGQNQIPVHFIKCDVEGHELDVLKGGQQVLRKFKPIISLESEARHCGEDNVINVFKFLDDLGYAGYFFNGESMLSLDSFDIQKYQLNSDKKKYVNNFFFIPKK